MRRRATGLARRILGWLTSRHEPQDNRRPLFNSGFKKIIENPNFIESIQNSLFAKPAFRAPKIEVPEIVHAPRPPTVLKATGDHSKPKVMSCNCKKSQCIKLYCECFRNQTFCRNCNCECCLNKTDNPTRSNVITLIKQKDPDAFEPKYKPTKGRIGLLGLEAKGGGEVLIDVSRGCNCKNSNCRKKYCECFQYGLECSSKCKCIGCQNGNFLKQSSKNGVTEEDLNVTPEERAAMRSKLIDKLTMIKRIKFSKPVVF